MQPSANIENDGGFVNTEETQENDGLLNRERTCSNRPATTDILTNDGKISREDGELSESEMACDKRPAASDGCSKNIDVTEEDDDGGLVRGQCRAY